MVVSCRIQDQLKLFKNYFVTGDYVVGGVGLRGLGVNGVATGTINIPDTTQPNSSRVPDGADIVAAFFYWETVESNLLGAATGQQGFFNGYAITGTVLGNPSAPTSWSSGGCSGAAQGSKTMRAYRADVRPFLRLDSNGKIQANGAYQVRLADSGSGGAGVPFTLGASLVIIYGVQSPLVPLNSIVLYDGAVAPSNASPIMSQSIVGFYQAAAPPVAKITHIVGNGQPNKSESVFVNGVNLPSLYGALPPFPGIYNGSWDSPTWSVNAAVLANDSSETTSVVPAATNTSCVNWGAVIFSTTVQDTDGDGLLDVWEDNQGYTDVSTVDAAGNSPWVALPGANKNVKDIFVEIDYLSNLDGKAGNYLHSHLPKQAALDMVGNAFAAQHVNVHFDLGPGIYQGDLYVITYPVPLPNPLPPNTVAPPLGTGGNAIPESAVVCTDSPATLCQFPGQAAVGWKGGFLSVKKNATLGNFQSGRDKSYRYVLWIHALGGPRTVWTAFGATLPSTSVAKLMSIVNSGTTATVIIQTPGGVFKPGDCPNANIPACSDANLDRVTVTGAIGQPALNGTYHFANLNSTFDNINMVTITTFNITTAGVANGTYNFGNESRLKVKYGGPTGSSGRSDVGGGDSAVAFGKWPADDVPLCQADPSLTLAPGQAYCTNQVGTITAEAGTLLHELGHTFFLTHGGTFFPSGALQGRQINAPPGIPSYGLNCNPGFLSSMNYLFQTRGFPGDGKIDYSGQTLPNLSEAALNETLGIGSDLFGLPAAHLTRWYAPPNALDRQIRRSATRHCNGSPIGPNEPPAVRVDGTLAPGGTFSAPIDWNNDSTIETTGIPQDVNFNGVGDAPFPGFDDWINVDLRQMDSRANTFGFSSGGDVPPTDAGGGGDLPPTDAGGGGAEQTADEACSTADPPTGLSAVQSGSAVVLNWTAPGGPCPARRYDIWRATGSFPTLASVVAAVKANPALFTDLTPNGLNGAPPSTTFTDSNVSPNPYTYFVTENNNQGAPSGPSDPPATVTVSKIGTTTGVSSLTNPSIFGQSVTFTATVSAVAPGAGIPSGTALLTSSTRKEF